MTNTSTILVTGGCGYLGSQLLRDLAALFPDRTLEVRILDNLQQGRLRALMDLPPGINYRFVEGDIMDPGTVRYVLQDVDIVVHLAAIVSTPLSFENPAWLEQVNHWGTAQLVEACLQVGVPRLVFASTSAVFGPGGPHVETSLCKPQGPYAQSKMAAEQTLATAAERGLSVTILRIGTLYGLAPVTRFDAVANRFAVLAGTGHSLTVYGDGRQRRPLIHVRDASSAICHFVKTENVSGVDVYNTATVSASVLDIVEAIRMRLPDIDVRYTDQNILTRFSFVTENVKLLATGWTPQMTLEEGLAELAGSFTSFSPHLHADAERFDI